MPRRNRRRPLFARALCLFAAAPAAFAGGQSESVRPEDRPWIIVPQRAPAPGSRVRVERVAAEVRLDAGAAATTSLAITLANDSPRQTEAQLLLPVPDGAAVSAFSLDGVDHNGEPSVRLVPREDAERLYREIVRKMVDPGLLEFAGHALLRSSVFPVPAHGQATFRVTYTHVLEAAAGRTEYVLPRSESLEASGTEWSITVETPEALAASRLYSPTHEIAVEGRKITVQDPRTPGPFRLGILDAGDAPALTVYGYPDPAAGPDAGYFLAVFAPEAARDAGEASAVRREVTLVIDRSGSMNGRKFEQAIAAAEQVIAGLADGERFNIIDYSDTIETFRREPVEKNAETLAAARAYLKGIRAVGGTNIHDALLAALAQPAAEGCLPVVLFLTDGLPTVGVTREAEITAAAKAANRHDRRVFTFGVGNDVNAPLLNTIATRTRATARFVRPSEDVEAAVGQVYRQLYGPIVTSPVLRAHAGGADAAGALRDVLPGALPDVFEGDRIVVVGRTTRGLEELTLSIEADRPGRDGRAVVATLTPGASAASYDNAFVRRLWAQRKIGQLLDEIRVASASEDFDAGSGRFKELVDEIVRLSTEFGILTEYTAFLAAEPEDLAGLDLYAYAAEELGRRNIRNRTGAEAVAQQLADNRMLESAAPARAGSPRFSAGLPGSGGGAGGARPADGAPGPAIQQVADRTLYRQDGRWVDGRLIDRGGALEPGRTLTPDDEAYFDLLARLAREGRQGLMAVPGDVLVLIDGEIVLLRNRG